MNPFEKYLRPRTLIYANIMELSHVYGKRWYIYFGNPYARYFKLNTFSYSVFLFNFLTGFRCTRPSEKHPKILRIQNSRSRRIGWQRILFNKDSWKLRLTEANNVIFKPLSSTSVRVKQLEQGITYKYMKKPCCPRDQGPKTKDYFFFLSVSD